MAGRINILVAISLRVKKSLLRAIADRLLACRKTLYTKKNFIFSKQLDFQKTTLMQELKTNCELAMQITSVARPNRVYFATVVNFIIKRLHWRRRRFSTTLSQNARSSKTIQNVPHTVRRMNMNQGSFIQISAFRI